LHRVSPIRQGGRAPEERGPRPRARPPGRRPPPRRLVLSMKLDLTETQARIQREARDFAAREVAPVAADLDREARWPRRIVTRMGELGLLAVAIPADHGGAGLDHVSYALVVEEISAACGGCGAVAVAINALFCGPIHRFGTERQRREILAPAAAGRAIGCS